MGNKVIDHEQSWGSPAAPREVIAINELDGDLITSVWFLDTEGVSTPPP